MEELYTHCLRCKRKLKNPEAQKLGFGKICYKKWKEESEAYQKEWEAGNHRRHALRRLF